MKREYYSYWTHPAEKAEPQTRMIPMKTLNLTNPADSEIKFEISKFPDGQQQVKIVSTDNWGRYASEYKQFCIKTRINNFSDIEILICAVASLRELGAKEIELYAPYFLGSRSDRKFEAGSNNYLKTVICPLVNAIGFGGVKVLDPHSDVLEACLNRFKADSNYNLVYWALQNINKDKEANYVLMSPDAGALKKIYKVAENIKYEGEIITCSKSRGIDGKITKTEVPHFDITKDILLIDDICDGGRTFIEIAKVVRLRYESYDREKSHVPLGKLYLVVSHGIFSKGFDELHENFEAIYTTNSYKNLEPHYDLAGGGLLITKNFVKQFKVI